MWNPIPRYSECFMCGRNNHHGLNLVFYQNGQEVKVDIVWPESSVGYKDRVHGGLLTGVLDEAMGWACTIKTQSFYYTGTLNMRFMQAVRPHQEMEVRARMIKANRKIAYAEGELYLKGEAEPLVKSSGQFFAIDQSFNQEILHILEHVPPDNAPVTQQDFELH